MEYFDRKFFECVAKTAEKIIELVGKNKKGVLIVGAPPSHRDDSENELYSCFYLDRNQIWGEKWKQFRELPPRMTLENYRIFNYNMSYQPVEERVTGFQFWNEFKNAQGKAFIKAVQEQLSERTDIKFRVKRGEYVTLLKVKYKRIKVGG